MRKAIAAIIVICALTTLFAVSGYGAEYFIICNPSSCVCVRRSPKKGADVTGRLDCGDEIETDNRERNGYIHVLGITEYGEGWVHSGYVVEDKPVIERCMASVAAPGRVAARRFVNGKRLRWLNVCMDVRVYARSAEWTVTSKGFVKTMYLEFWNE